MTRHKPKSVMPTRTHDANITLQDFGKAMSTLDLSSVPPNKRYSAILDHLALIMGSTITDQSVASEVRGSLLLRKNKKFL